MGNKRSRRPKQRQDMQVVVGHSALSAVWRESGRFQRSYNFLVPSGRNISRRPANNISLFLFNRENKPGKRHAGSLDHVLPVLIARRTDVESDGSPVGCLRILAQVWVTICREALPQGLRPTCSPQGTSTIVKGGKKNSEHKFTGLAREKYGYLFASPLISILTIGRARTLILNPDLFRPIYLCSDSVEHSSFMSDPGSWFPPKRLCPAI